VGWVCVVPIVVDHRAQPSHVVRSRRAGAALHPIRIPRILVPTFFQGLGRTETLFGDFMTTNSLSSIKFKTVQGLGPKFEQSWTVDRVCELSELIARFRPGSAGLDDLGLHLIQERGALARIDAVLGPRQAHSCRRKRYRSCGHGRQDNRSTKHNIRTRNTYAYHIMRVLCIYIYIYIYNIHI